MNKIADIAAKQNNAKVITLAVIVVALLVGLTIWLTPAYQLQESAYADTEAAMNAEDVESMPEWKEAGYESASDYHKALNQLGEESKNVYSDFIDKYDSVATDDQKAAVKTLAASMANPSSKYTYDEDKKALEEIKKDCDQAIASRQAAKSSSNYSSGASYAQPSGNGVLTRSNGSIYYNGHRETWYSTNEAGQTVTAYNIPGKHVGDDGIIRDKDGYICVASKNHGAGTVIETSRGTGKVYDKCGTDAVDIYTAW